MNSQTDRVDEMLDPSFGVDGTVRLNYQNLNFNCRDFSWLEDGGLLVLTREADSRADYRVFKLTTSGELDSRFGNNGELVLNLANGEHLDSLHVTDEKFTVIGASSSHLILFRHDLLGIPDATFGRAGEIRIEVENLPPDLSENTRVGRGPLTVRLAEEAPSNERGQSGVSVSGSVFTAVDRGRYFIAFNAYWLDDPAESIRRGVPVIVCLANTGKLTETFNGGRPKFITLIDSGDVQGSIVSDLVIQPGAATDGNLLLLGARGLTVGLGSRYALRVLADGRMDYSFGNGEGDEQGQALIPEAYMDYPTRLTVDSDGGFKASGYTLGGDAAVLSFTEDGDVDNRFGNAGHVPVDLWLFHGVTSSGTGDDYRFTGFQAVRPSNIIRVVRLLQSGKLDPDFGTGGFFSFAHELEGSGPGKLGELPDHNIVLGIDNAILRLLSHRA